MRDVNSQSGACVNSREELSCFVTLQKAVKTSGGYEQSLSCLYFLRQNDKSPQDYLGMKRFKVATAVAYQPGTVACPSTFSQLTLITLHSVLYAPGNYSRSANVWPVR